MATVQKGCTPCFVSKICSKNIVYKYRSVTKASRALTFEIRGFKGLATNIHLLVSAQNVPNNKPDTMTMKM